MMKREKKIIPSIDTLGICFGFIFSHWQPKAIMKEKNDRLYTVKILLPVLSNELEGSVKQKMSFRKRLEQHFSIRVLKDNIKNSDRFSGRTQNPFT